MTTTEEKSASQPWNCYSNFIVCKHNHLLRFHESGYSADMRRVSGHAFLCCKQCRPPSYFFVVFVTVPDPHAICYEISESCYREWDRGDARTMATPEMLYLLRDAQGRSYNPGWRPPR